MKNVERKNFSSIRCFKNNNNQGKCALYNFVLIEIIEKVERQGGDFSPRNEDIPSRNTLGSLVED